LEYEKPNVADHINHKKFDNRDENLRVVSQRENDRNRTKPSNNTSNKLGVNRSTNNKNNSYWRVQITDNDYKPISKLFSIQKLGEDEAKRQAIEYRKQLEVQYNYIGD
jgi:hypothetical protein